MKQYKAKCPKCNTVFGFAEKELNTKIELDKNQLDIEVYMPCVKCGLKLTLLNMETRISSIEEYSN